LQGESNEPQQGDERHVMGSFSNDWHLATNWRANMRFIRPATLKNGWISRNHPKRQFVTIGMRFESGIRSGSKQIL